VRSDTEDAVSSITRAVLEESPFGSVAVRAVTVFEGSGPDDESYLHLVISAADPPSDQGTWPRDDVFRLRSRVHELASQIEAELPRIVVDLFPEHADEPEEETGNESDTALANRLDDSGS
jgi:hypothetical protein